MLFGYGAYAVGDSGEIKNWVGMLNVECCLGLAEMNAEYAGIVLVFGCHAEWNEASKK